MTEKIDTKLLEHEFVPKHIPVSKEEEERILKEYGIKKFQLPKILKDDPAIVHLKPKRGDLIQIMRDSKTAGRATYYRVVI